MTKEELENFYIKERHTKQETCILFCISERQLYKYMKKFGLSKHSTLSKDILYRHLVVEGLSYKNIANLYNKSVSTIRKIKRSYSIQIPKEIISKRRAETNIIKYGHITPLKNEAVKKKSEETSMKKYGCKKAAESKQIRQIAGKSIKEARIRNHTTQTELMRDENKRKQFISKRNETLIENSTAGKSREEDYVYTKLLEVFGDVKRHYSCELYPFLCDFYVSSLDLYIEYQGFWMHGKDRNEILGAYDKVSVTHKKVLKKWIEKSKTMPIYKNAIRVWTINDPLKRETAEKNRLNWIEFFTIEEFNQWLIEQ